ncbi:envelope stress response membrane protein PspC [Xenorhabdus nematophila]|uniref:Transcriptional activator of the psp operon with PspB, phage shock protein n=1 Tax=Xenorhabdus nematophila (strain ATCC 19061 / DSM 3370 / CCUG 14189 / LMG 1036 / NCIMB 9965 / AN6) TaxID=406817 RepID=D3VHM9_XENNA|nr:envelope stress response membrane protein PspC [Xenorhabdus nematophila]CEE90097.1 transcriptional activator of the psp operon with PspB, phage shock protein [Xenorhabdus nematophila str. Anatoliense]CEF29712.1 transcriptional activator of the psp operon with PspB, phage shock protein [Xenorhabdus nematophila str. Websteri]AYA40013.1 envelope stress response membrane protein PspC [Xenorhabdus nematophila]KHD28235.1 transcriptional regulator [Xenorhabdus nematophila]MBA0018654.1 envelope str
MSNTYHRKLYRLPEQGMVKGVCAGLANYFDVPVALIRTITVLSLFFGLFGITVLAYIILTFAMDPAPAGYSGEGNNRGSSAQRILDEVDYQLRESEARLRQMERYITSETYSVRSRFRQL